MSRKFYRYIILIIIFQGFLFSLGYNISGIVLDSKTREPIKNINIYSLDENIAVITDENGYFNLFLKNFSKKNINLNIKVIGYEEELILVDLLNNNIDLGNIFLKVKSIDLDPVKIYTSNINQSSQISDITIGGLELNENLKANIATTLSNYSNIGINSFGVVTSKPSLRGFSGDRFLLTKDGSETGDLSQSSIDHVITLDMSEVNQIEIIRGPKSLIYGPNAIGGVINTTLSGNPKTRVDKFSTKFVFGSESSNSSNFSLFNQGSFQNVLLYFPGKNSQLNLSLNSRTTENQTSPIGTLKNTNSKTESFKFGLTLYDVNKYLNFVFENYNMNYGIPPTPGSIGHITGIDIPLDKKSFQIHYHQDILFKTITDFDFKYNFINYEHKEIIPNSFNDYELLLRKYTQNFKLEVSSSNLLFGSEINMRKFESDGINETPVTDEKNISFYGFYERQNNTFDILSSFRLGYFSIKPSYYNFIHGNANLIETDDEGNPILDDDGNQISSVVDRKFYNLSFSFGIRKQINDFEFNSWIMHTMRPPRVEELYSDGPHLATYAFEIGNPNLKAERIYGIENSISFNSKPFNFSIVTFYNYSPYYFQMTKDGSCEEAWLWDPYSGTSHPCNSFEVPGSETWIDFGSAPLGWLYIYSPKGNKVIIKGFEIDLGYHLEKFELNYNLSFVKGDNKTLDMPLSYMTPMKQILDFNYSQNFMNYKIRFSKIHAQDRLGEFETYTAGTSLVDFIVSYSYKKHNVTIQFNNVFDKIYYNHLSRIKSFMPEPGRNIHLVYKVLI